MSPGSLIDLPQAGALCQAGAVRTQAPTSPPLQGWTVLSLRPRGQHAGLRAAAARRGARTLALSPFAIEPYADAATRDALARALRADIVVYTSANAVAAAASIRGLKPRRGQPVLAVGSGTQRALRWHGVEAHAPRRMDSEGLLAMPQLAGVARRRVAVVTGTDGRNAIAPALRDRGAEVLRVDVYARAPLPLSQPALDKLRDALADPRRVLLVLSSGDALRQAMGGLPDALRRRLARVAVVAASARLAAAAGDAGFRRVAIAADARPASLLRAAIDAFV